GRTGPDDQNTRSHPNRMSMPAEERCMQIGSASLAKEGGDPMPKHCSFLLVGLAATIYPAVLLAAEPPASPAYQIVLRSRNAQATPTRTKDAETGGGWIVVEQPERNTIIATMGGSAVVGSECHGSTAAIDF